MLNGLSATKKKLITGAVLVVALGLGGALLWQSTQTAALPDGISMSNGRIEAERIEVATKLSGRISETLIAEGDWVAAGQVVARLEVTEVQAQMRQAQATVVQAQQQKLQAEALLRQRQSELTTAQAEFTRIEQLATKDFATQSSLDSHRTVLATAQAAVAAADAGISLADATIAAALAAVERIQSLIDDSSLIAPRAGRVQYVLAHAGEVVAAGSSVVTLTDLSDMYMAVFLPSRDAGRLAIGAEARIVLDAIPDYVIPATVTFVASSAQFTPRSVETEQERDQLMFRVKLTIAPELLANYQERARAGVPGVGYVRVLDSAVWPDNLTVRLPQ
ncbi:HlyD family secretion protein [Pseudorhodobacter wandonensis]|uniref:HlyD family secretion protein n=1 Tax=Pseudorhodobacter wandonensis TaxID=1120568 RepID=UPI00067DFD26|nr:HlyD family efflux transporter periplasmic adaptor subunit [Pseudorhodobacter wandonensis]